LNKERGEGIDGIDVDNDEVGGGREDDSKDKLVVVDVLAEDESLPIIAPLPLEEVTLCW
jgi:hypothetical protein